MLLCLFFKTYLWLFHDVIYGINLKGIQAFMAACTCAVCKHLWTSSMCAMFQACIGLDILSRYGWQEQMFLKAVASRSQRSRLGKHCAQLQRRCLQSARTVHQHEYCKYSSSCLQPFEPVSMGARGRAAIKQALSAEQFYLL